MAEKGERERQREWPQRCREKSCSDRAPRGHPRRSRPTVEKGVFESCRNVAPGAEARPKFGQFWPIKANIGQTLTVFDQIWWVWAICSAFGQVASQCGPTLGRPWRFWPGSSGVALRGAVREDLAGATLGSVFSPLCHRPSPRALKNLLRHERPGLGCRRTSQLWAQPLPHHTSWLPHEKVGAGSDACPSCALPHFGAIGSGRSSWRSIGGVHFGNT